MKRSGHRTLGTRLRDYVMTLGTVASGKVIAGRNLIKDSRQDIPFIRTAKAGGWQTSLSKESATRIEAEWGGTMEMLGYACGPRRSETHEKRAAAICRDPSESTVV